MKRAQVGHNRTHHWFPEIPETRHGFSGNAIRNDLKEFVVRKLANVDARNNVGSALAAFSIQPVAAGTIRGKRLLPFGGVDRSPRLGS